MEDYVLSARDFYEIDWTTGCNPLENHRYMDVVNKFLSKQRDIFSENLSGKRVLDLGSGPGRDAIYFKSRGLEPVCVDISLSSMKLCRQNGLNSSLMQGHELGFADCSFDGVWTCGFLNHFPKPDLGHVLKEIHRVLKPQGVLFGNVHEGFLSCYMMDPRFNKNPGPFLSQYLEEEFFDLFKGLFEKVYFSNINYEGHSELTAVYRKN